MQLLARRPVHGAVHDLAAPDENRYSLNEFTVV